MWTGRDYDREYEFVHRLELFFFSYFAKLFTNHKKSPPKKEHSMLIDKADE